MQVGERFVPWDVFPGAYLPLALTAYTGISSSSKIVWSMLNYIGRDTGFSSPSQGELAERCGMSARTIGNCLTELQDKGFIAADGKHDRAVVWAFLWHECFDGGRLRKLPTSSERSAQELPSSERESKQDLPTTAETDSARSAEIESEAAEAANSADIADDSRQDLRMIVGNNCGLASSDIIEEIPEKEGREGPPPPGTGLEGMEQTPGVVVGDGRDPPHPEHSSAVKAIFDDLREMIPRQVLGDKALAHRLTRWLNKVTPAVVRRAIEILEDKIRDRTFRGGSKINALESIIENLRREHVHASSGDRTDADLRRGLPNSVGL